MKKLSVLIIALLVAALTLSGCTQTQNVLDAGWRRDYTQEVFTYEITKTGVAGEGTLVLTIRHIRGEETLTVPALDETYALTTTEIQARADYSIVTYDFDFGTNVMDATIVMDNNLKPVYAFRNADFSSAEVISPYRYQVTYLSGKATTVIAYKNAESGLYEKKEIADFTLPTVGATFDSDGLVFILRSLSSIGDKNCSYSYGVYTPHSGELISLFTRSTPDQTLEDVPYFTRDNETKTVNCHKVSLTLANIDITGKSKYIYYSASTVTANDADMDGTPDEVRLVPVKIEEGDVTHQLKDIQVTK